MSKKAYYFIVDALIAATILIVGFILINSLYISEPEKIELKDAADNIMNFLSATKLLDLCTAEGDCSDKVLQSNFDSIRNKDNSLLEVIGELVSAGSQERAGAIIRSIVVDNKMVPLGYNFTFFIEDKVIYPEEQFEMTATDPLMKKSKALVVSKKVIFGYFEEPVTVYWGPYTAEARIWRLEHFIRCKTNADCLGMECDKEYGICTEHLVREGDFCPLSCKDERFECKFFECIRKESPFLQLCRNQAGCGPGYYCSSKMQCVYSPGDVNDPCGYNNDCNTGLICENGRCSPVYSQEGDDCSATGKCGIGLYCLYGICKKTNGNIGSGCDSHTDCLSGSICHFETGKCEEGTYNINADCNLDEECGPGLICDEYTQKCKPTSGENGQPCGNDIDCGVGMICDDETKTCQKGDANPNAPCAKEEDCGNGLTCDLTLEPPICVGEECAQQSDCGAGLICDMSLEPPKCIVTADGSRAVCYTDSDCSAGFYCDEFRCTNGMNKEGDPCEMQEDCGAGLICNMEEGKCQTAEGNPCDICYSFTDCNKLLPQGNTICIDGACYLPDNENGDCSALGYCQCGPGFFCADADSSCHGTNGNEGDFCNDDTDCRAGLECIYGFCASTGDVTTTNICGDGIIDFLTEQCEEGMTTDCGALNCDGTGTVTCNPLGSADECRWDKVGAGCSNCPVCDYPADCRENCIMDFDETQALFNFWKANINYDCGGRKPEYIINPTIQLTQCSLTLYSLGIYDTTWPTKTNCQGIS